MKTLGYITVTFLVGIFLCVKNGSAQMNVEKVYVDKVSVNTNKPVTEKLTKKSDNALRVNFFKLIFIEINNQMPNLNEFSSNDNDPLIEYRGMANIVFSISADKKIEILNVFGNNPKLVSFVKEIFAKKTLFVPQAVEGRYMLPVRI